MEKLPHEPKLSPECHLSLHLRDYGYPKEAWATETDISRLGTDSSANQFGAGDEFLFQIFGFLI